MDLKGHRVVHLTDLKDLKVTPHKVIRVVKVHQVKRDLLVTQTKDQQVLLEIIIQDLKELLVTQTQGQKVQ